MGLSDIDSAWYCYNRFYEIASTKLKDSLLKAKAMDNIAVVYVHKGDLEKALHYRTRSTAIYQELGEKKLLANGNMWLGNIYKEKKDLTEAIRYYMLAKKYCEELGDESVLPYVLINLSAVYTAIDEHEEAIDYAKQTMALFEKLGSKSGQAITLFRVSYSLMQTNRYEEALENLLLAESIFTSIGDRYFLSLVYNRLALIYSRWEQWDKAEWYYKKAMAYPEETERFPDLVNIYHGLASMYMMKRDYRKSLEYFRKTEQIYNHLNDKTPIRNMYYNYITLFAGLNQPDSVDFYVSKQKAITDTLIRQSTNRAVEDLQAKYDAEKKAKDLALVALELKKASDIFNNSCCIIYIIFDKWSCVFGFYQ